MLRMGTVGRRGKGQSGKGGLCTKEKTPLLLAYTQKYLDRELLKQIELEVLKLAEKFSQKIVP